MRDKFIKCPKCGSIMRRIEEVHTELDSYPNTEVWWECSQCGTATDNYGYEDVIDPWENELFDPYENSDWDRVIRKVNLKNETNEY